MEKTKIEVNVLEFMIKNAENFIFWFKLQSPEASTT